MPRKTTKVNDSPLKNSEQQPSDIIIATDGDVVLKFQDPKTKAECRYRCSRTILSSESEYFQILFDADKFKEGRDTEAKLQELLRRYHEPTSIPSSDLPAIAILDVEELFQASALTSIAIKLFFEILHDPATPWPLSKSQSIESVGLLAIIADMFAAKYRIRCYLCAHTLDMTLLKDRKNASARLMELKNRQRLLAGLVFGLAPWVRQCSAALILDGPKRQTTLDSVSSGDQAQEEGSSWWHLPHGVEEELACRRAYILDTLSSIQKHFINLYIKKPQCRLGYGSSPVCDSFQLGETIKFLSRKGTIRMESTFDTPIEELEPYNGNIMDIIAKLKECTNYQIDEHHTHCGLRTRLIPILSSLELGQAGICLSCWETDMAKESWLESPKQDIIWLFTKQNVARGCEEHREAKSMFTAGIRDWTYTA